MNCIFCNSDKPKSKEHIIPENIGGTIIIDNVCKSCNSILGSEVDIKLIRNRHIYDAYNKLSKRFDIDLKFEFRDSFYHMTDGTQINASKKSNEEKTLITRTGKNEFVIDDKNTMFIIDYIKSKGKGKKFSKDIIDEAISNYLKWHNGYDTIKKYEDELFEFWICRNYDHVVYNNVMDADTPHRFISKACVEFSSLFKIDDQIENLSILKSHALFGNKLNEINIFQELHPEIEPIPFHIIMFESNQFIIGIFAQVYFAIELNWINEPIQLRFANNLNNKKLVYCEEINGRLKSTDREYTK